MLVTTELVKSIIDLQSNWELCSVAAPRSWSGNDGLFAYYCKIFLPSLVHEHSHPRYHNFSHWVNLAIENRPSMEAALACAAMSISHKISSDPQTVRRMRQRALVHQAAAITTMRESISSGNVSGTEDWLLATAILLTLFDNRDPSCHAWSGGTHVRVIIQLFKCRQAVQIRHHAEAECDNDTPHLGFERICYESLLFHGTIMMTYDRNFDILVTNETWQIICEYFQSCLLPVGQDKENWPLLCVPYNLFHLIVRISRLARRSPLGEDDLAIAAAITLELRRWGDLLALDLSSPGKLYVLAAKILLDNVLSRQPDNMCLKDSIKTGVRCFVNEMATVAVGPLFSRYNLWPLSIVEHMATDAEDKRLIKGKMAEMLRSMDGGGVVEVPQELIDRFLDIPGL